MKELDNSLETKILKLTSILLLLFSVIASLTNFFLKLEPIVTIIAFILGIANLGAWWILKRYHGFKIVRLFITIVIFLAINFEWYYNYTSSGPILTYFLLFVVFVVFIWSSKIVFYIIPFIILNIVVLFYLNYNYSEIFLKYPSEITRINDVYLGILVALIVIFIFSYQAKLLYIEKYRQAKKSDELKSAFLATMTHELRTPLNAIIGFSGLIDKDLEVDEIINYAKIINTNGNHLNNVIENLFDLSLINSNQIKIVKEKVELQTLLTAIHAIVTIDQQKANKNNIELNLVFPPKSKDITLNTDPARFKQVLINLLRNALKFTHEGHVNYGYFFEADNGNPHLKFFVEDTGIGISKDNKESIFDNFIQAENSFAREYDGIGIGLSISKKLVVALGGNIWMESTLGKGSTFYFTIPYLEHVTSINKIKTGIEFKSRIIKNSVHNNKTI